MTTDLKQSHTPGPWSFDQDSGEVFFDDHGVCPVAAFVNGELTSPEQAAADGQLIAAAPELLDALKALEEFADRVSGRVEPGYPAIERARAAIAKAEGR